MTALVLGAQLVQAVQHLRVPVLRHQPVLPLHVHAVAREEHDIHTLVRYLRVDEMPDRGAHVGVGGAVVGIGRVVRHQRYGPGGKAQLRLQE